MDQRFKLAIAAVALGLLIAGGVRRWTKENQSGRSSSPANTEGHVEPDSHLSFSGDRNSPQENRPIPGYSQGDVAPAAASFPVGATVSGAQESGEDSTDSFLPDPQHRDELANQPDDAWRRLPTQDSDLHHWPDQPEAQGLGAPVDAAVPQGAYFVQPGDSFWTISERVYGSGRYFNALYEHNRRLCPQPDRLQPGIVIETPQPYALERSYPELLR
jgi:nucleoid-associated protein YgaU